MMHKETVPVVISEKMAVFRKLILPYKPRIVLIEDILNYCNSGDESGFFNLQIYFQLHQLIKKERTK